MQVEQVLFAYVHGVDEQEGHVLSRVGGHHHGREPHEPQHGLCLQHAQVPQAVDLVLLQMKAHHGAAHGPVLIGRDLPQREPFLQDRRRIQADHLLYVSNSILF